MPDYSLIAIASLVLLCAHALRVGRWALLFPRSGIVPHLSYLSGLAAGYAINAFVPFRLGELLRIWIVVRAEKQRFAFVAATVALERLTDLAAVALIFAVLLTIAGAAPFPGVALTACVMAGLAVAGGILGIAIRRSLRLRRVLWAFAGLFNTRISLGLADFFWVFSELVTARIVLRWPYIGMSIAMWAGYLASYALFARGMGIGEARATVDILGRPAASMLNGTGSATVLYALYTLIPVALVLCIGLVRSHVAVRRLLRAARRIGEIGTTPFAGQDRFTTAETYNRFLADQFRGNDALASSFWSEALDDCVMHRFFNGGSDAITALVEVDGQLRIRKFAIGGAAEKLADQADWLRREAANGLPLVSIVAEKRTADFYSYDMPLVTPSNDFYDVIHTLDSARSERIFAEVIDRIDRFHALSAAPDASDAVIGDYLAHKAAANARSILDFIESEFDGRMLEINGHRFDLATFERLLDPVWLRAQIRSRKVARVHGDLTIENVIVAPGVGPGFFLIDPNPENIFNTPLIDWAKLMQSLHLGYETLNRGMTCRIEGTAIEVPLSRSQAYSALQQSLEAELTRRYGADALREVQFHEIVNYLRLTTYKIRQNRTRGIGFFACTCLLLGEYSSRWGEET